MYNHCCDRHVLPITIEKTEVFCVPCFNERNSPKKCKRCRAETPVLTYQVNDGVCMSCHLIGVPEYPEFTQDDLPIKITDLEKLEVDSNFSDEQVWQLKTR